VRIKLPGRKGETRPGSKSRLAVERASTHKEKKDMFYLVTWLAIFALIAGPFWVGCYFEEKLRKTKREFGWRLLRCC
jgi:hypothetical protein